MKALITGIAGFAGSHLAEELLGHGYQVCGTHLPGESLKNLTNCLADLKLYPLDFHHPEDITPLFKAAVPDYIFHLAGQPAVEYSFRNPLETYQVNFLGTFYILEAARNLTKLQGLLMVSSSDIYGIVKPRDLPLTPAKLLEPVSPYGISKAAADMLCFQYFKNYGLPVVRARAFAHSGPRQSRGFAIPDFCGQIAAFEKSPGEKELLVGNLKARRDISDVRDVVAGYRLALEKGRPGDIYQLCGGKAYGIRNLLNKLLKMAAIKIRLRVDPGLIRPTEIPVIVGDASAAEKRLGYKRKYSIDDTLRDCLEYYRSL